MDSLHGCKITTVYIIQLAHQHEIISGFYSKTRVGIQLFLPLVEMLVHSSFTPSSKFADTFDWREVEYSVLHKKYKTIIDPAGQRLEPTY